MSGREAAVLLLDRDGYLVGFNQQARSEAGWSNGETIGRHFSSFYPSDQLAQGRAEAALIIAESSGKFLEEAWGRDSGGAPLWRSALITALRDKKGMLSGFVIVCGDPHAS